MANPAPEPPHMPSGEVVFDQIVQRTSRLFDERTAQNTRASFVLGSASVFLGIVAGGFSAFVNTLHAYRGPFIWGLVVRLGYSWRVSTPPARLMPTMTLSTLTPLH